LALRHSKQVSWLPRYTCWLAFLVACLALGACGGDDGDGGGSTEAADTQTITFQEPEDPGEDPFTPPADVEGPEEVQVSQPFGGSGSNRVCDRDKLIKFLEANPERMAEWARVLGLEPRIGVVKKYIAKLHPVTLTQDTQVTNHAYTNGQAVPFQAILQAGTAVLVDEYGVPVVRCYCGNPLGPAVYTPEAKCTGCPPDYTPPKQCEFKPGRSYDRTYYRRDYYANGDYDEVFIRSHRSSPYKRCYEAYPDPPVVTAVNIYEGVPEPEPAPAPAPAPAPVPEPAPEPTLQCNPPRSQLEAERCAELEGNAPQPAPAPPPPPPPTDICNDGLDNEGEPGLIDEDDPNCQ
jgi:hypothetical protein